jgi:hypothetical protein
VASVEGARGADAADVGTRITRPGFLVGTLAYASPEQVLGQQATSQSDLFAFGVVVHEMLTGTHPFRRDTRPETEAAILRDNPQSVARIGPAVAPPIARLIDRCLEKDSSNRPESARDLALFLEALDGAAAGGPVADAGVDPASLRRLRARLLAGACALLLLMTGVMWGYVRLTGDRVVGEVLDADLARAERTVRRVQDEQLTRLGLAARLVASFPELKALFATDVATIQDFLLGYRQRVPDTPLLIALARDGSVLARTDEAPAGAGGDEWLQALAASPGEGRVVSIDSRPHLAIAVPSEAGATVFGYLAAAQPLDQGFAQTLSDATQDDVVLLSDEGVLASTLRVQAPWRSLDGWRASGGRADRVADLRVGAQRFAAREVPLAGEPAVSAVIMKSRDEAIGPYVRVERGLIAIGLGAAAATLLGVFWLFRRPDHHL